LVDVMLELLPIAKLTDFAAIDEDPVHPATISPTAVP
jgi:hypothetical protein